MLAHLDYAAAQAHCLQASCGLTPLWTCNSPLSLLLQQHWSGAMFTEGSKNLEGHMAK